MSHRTSTRARMALAAALGLVLGLFDPTAGARSGDPELYRWTDRDGVVRYTPHRDRVPVSQRSTLEVVRVTPEPDVAAGPPPSSERPVAHRVPQPAPAPEPLAEPEPTEPERQVGTTAPAPGDASLAHHEPEPAPAPAPIDPPAPPEVGTTAPEPPQPAAGLPARDWAVQLSAAPLSESPEHLPAIVLPDGTRLYRAPLVRDGKRWERIRVGFFASRAEAGTAAAALGERFPGAWVARVGGAERAEAALPPVAAAPPASPPLVITEPLPAPIAQANVERRYAIQLRALPLADGPIPFPLLELDGFRLYRTTVERDGEVWERLRLGFFASEMAARHKLQQLGRSFPDAWIVLVSPSEQMLASRTASAPLLTAVRAG